MAVARAGEDDVPVQAAPVALRPFLHFAKLPPRALVAARRALDADAAFRARVAEQVSADDVGPAGWLLLTRPPGWEAELEALARRAEEARAVVVEQRAEDGARRRLGAAEGAARRAEETAAAARAELAAAASALAEERRARRAATKEAAELARRAEALVAERDRARADADAMATERDRATAERARAVAAEAARAELRAAAANAADATAVREARPAPAAAPVARDPVSDPDPGAAVARRESAAALGSAADAARALADALADAARALAGPDGAAAPATTAVAPRTGAPAAGSVPGGRAGRRPPAPTRTAAPLPPATFEESLEAAEHLARLPGVVILVDGYNVSQAGWPGTPIADQRRRLVDALAELVARTGADVRVVFDGADTAEPQPVPTTARSVRVRFSPPGVEADDVIVAEVGDIPAPRPVVVASSDRRVRDESQARGANLMRSSQLLALLRR